MFLNSQNITIHIGMPKTASTTLQNNFFNRLPNINYVGINNTTIAEKLFFRIIHQEPAYFNVENIKNGIANLFTNDLPTVFSSEIGCGPIIPLSKGIPQNRKIIALRLKEIFPNARILLIVRNQKSIQKSIYSQLLKSENNHLSFRSLPFRKWIDLNIRLYEKGVQNVFDFADYYSLINIYLNLFKEVKVVVFEEMVKNFESFITNELGPFIGIDPIESSGYFINQKENVRHSKASILIEKNIKRALNVLDIMGSPQKIISGEKREKFMTKVHRTSNLISFGKIKTEYTEEQLIFLKKFYADGNKKISDVLEIDLGEYGYLI